MLQSEHKKSQTSSSSRVQWEHLYIPREEQTTQQVAQKWLEAQTSAHLPGPTLTVASSVC